MESHPRPKINPSDYDLHTFPALVFRTDHSNDSAWAEILDEMAETEYSTVDVHAITGPDWEGATPEEVLAALPSPAQSPTVVYVADSTAMNTTGCPLLAVEARAENPETRQEFRVEAGSVTLIHGNLAIGHIGFWELVDKAAEEPDGVLRD